MTRNDRASRFGLKMTHSRQSRSKVGLLWNFRGRDGRKIYGNPLDGEEKPE